MASLFDLLCYHSLQFTDPLLEEILVYLPTRFHSHFFDYSAYEHSSDDELVHSIDSSISAFYSDDSTYFSKILSKQPYFSCNSKIFTKTGIRHTKRPPAENDRRTGREPEAPTLLESHRSWRATSAVLDVRTKSTPRTAEPTADGWTALAAQTSLILLSVGRAELLLKGALACTAIVHPPCILKRASIYRKSLAPPSHNWLSLWVPGTAAPIPLSLPDQGSKPHEGWGISLRDLKYRQGGPGRGIRRHRGPLRRNLHLQRLLIIVSDPTTTKY